MIFRFSLHASSDSEATQKGCLVLSGTLISSRVRMQKANLANDLIMIMR
jgi:hypothetical protein